MKPSAENILSYGVIFQDASDVNDSDLEEQILQHFAARGRARHIHRSRRQTSSGLNSSEVFSYVSSENGINLGYGLEAGSATIGVPASTIEHEPSSVLPFPVNVTLDTAETRNSHVNHRYQTELLLFSRF